MTRRAPIVAAAVLAAVVGAWLALRDRLPLDVPPSDARSSGTSAPRQVAPISEVAPADGLAPAPARAPEAPPARAADAAGTAPPSPGAPPTGAGGALHGRVLSGTWTPLAHAHVHRVDDPVDAPAIESREDGTFDVAPLGDRTAVWVHAPGLVMASDALGWLARGTRNEIRLVAGAPIRVTLVSGASARPVAGARVRSIAGDAAWSARYARPSDEATTDADGRATVLVPPGSGYVVVAASGFATTRSPTVEVPEAGVDLRVELGVGATVEGVVGTEAGKPVAAAIVRLVAGDLYERTAVTQADGRFRLDGVPAGVGPVGLSARAEGFGPTVVGLESLDAGASKRLDVRLATAHVLDVLCLHEDGSPADDVDVRVRSTDANWNLVEGADRPAASGRTGADGHVHLEPVAAGEWLVEVFERHGSTDFPSTTVSVPTDAGRVVSIVVRPPARPLPPPFTVHVLDPDGAPIPEATLRVRGLIGPPSRPRPIELEIDDAETDSSGTAAIRDGIPPTSIVVVAPGFAPSIHPVTAADRARGETTLRLSRRSATLRFVRLDGTPAPVRVVLESLEHLEFGWTRYGYESGFRSPELPTDGEGTVTFRGLGDSWYRPMISDGDAVILSGPADFQAGTERLVWTIVARDEAQTLSTPIRLLDASTEESIGRARVVVVESGQQCSFAIGAGPFYLSPPMQPGEHDLDVFAEGFRPLRVPHVTLAGAEKPVVLRLTLERGATIAGTVTDADGRPVPDVGIEVRDTEGASATTDEAGSFAISGLAEGPQTLVATSRLIARAVEWSAKAVEARTVRADAVVEPAGAVVVSTTGGFPLATIVVRLSDVRRAETRREETRFGGSIGGGYNPDLQEICTFDGLPPVRYWLDVAWNGVTGRSIPVEVRLGKTTRVTIAPP